MTTMVRAVLIAIVGAAAMMAGCAADEAQTVAPAAGSTGAEIYASSCASCHGTDLRGTDKGPSQLSIVYEPNHHPDAAYRSAIINGAGQHHWNFGDMEPVEGLDDEQIEAVIAYIRSEQQRLGFEG